MSTYRLDAHQRGELQHRADFARRPQISFVISSIIAASPCLHSVTPHQNSTACSPPLLKSQNQKKKCPTSFVEVRPRKKTQNPRLSSSSNQKAASYVTGSYVTSLSNFSKV
ncbi:hypothetical protein AVEN_168448-1 [Araneus ventricosus]|uniref:Uncharacterized protein n=1 Tax=Araneus ventricosus TaxID=182803 RepID=A0A4Y2GRB2_ARAVE|nr:hypothetical protein AVEN_168448-1 [Araneus ventricosus]